MMKALALPLKALGPPAPWSIALTLALTLGALLAPGSAAQAQAQNQDQAISASAVAPSRWQPLIAHAGQKARLIQWWGQWNDLLLVALIEAAQNTQTSLKGSLHAVARVHDIMPPERPAQRADSASWEASIADAAHGGALPLPGGLTADADWHPGRVAIAAETAEQYFGWIHCRQIGGNCVARLRALAILTGLPIGEVGERLLARGTSEVSVPRIETRLLRARWLEQRPDVAAAMLEVERSRIEIARAEAQRHPRLQLLGELGPDRFGALQAQAQATAPIVEPELVGPVLSIPPFDAQRLQSVLEVRQADYLAAASDLRSRAKEAAREAEEALATLLAAQTRSKEAWIEQAMAWVHLYRVVGGGWGKPPAP